MGVELINPGDLVKARGYSHGAIASGRMLYVAGQVGVDAEGKLVGEDFVSQFGQALAGVVRVVQEAGGQVEDIAKMTIFVTDMQDFCTANIGEAYGKNLGRHFPAMTVVETGGLVSPGYKVEIEAVAQLPD